MITINEKLLQEIKTREKWERTCRREIITKQIDLKESGRSHKILQALFDLCWVHILINPSLAENIVSRNDFGTLWYSLAYLTYAHNTYTSLHLTQTLFYNNKFTALCTHPDGHFVHTM